MAGKRIKIAVSFGIVAAVLGWLLISGFNENMQYYVSIKEVKAMPADDLTKGLRVKGKLVSGSLEQNAENLDKSFRIVQDNEELTVHYSGLLPDTFKEGAEVLVEGKYTDAGYFHAQKVMAKCPSKYETTDTYDQKVGNYKSTNSDVNKEGTY